MAQKYCNLCERNVEPKRVIGVGALILAVLTCGLWLLLILFYSKRCPICKSTDLGSPNLKEGDGSSSTPSGIVIVLYMFAFFLVLGIYNNLNEKPVEILKQGSESTREMKLYNEVRKIPASQWKKNRDIYSELMNLNPSKKLYSTKYYYYSKKIDEAEEKENALANKSDPYLQTSLRAVRTSSTGQNIDQMVGCSVDGATRTGQAYKIKGSSIIVWKGPSKKHSKVINQKASSKLNKTHYVTVDNTVTVHEECSLNGWSKIQVTDPDWLSSSHRGWIASKFLRDKKVDASGTEKFTADDFIWDKTTRPYKNIIVTGVNKVHKENSSCKHIDPSSAYISGSRGSQADPVFYVTCGTGSNMFNVYFSKSDVEKGKKMSGVQPVSETGAMQKCADGIRAKVMFPSTVDLHIITGTSVKAHPNGNTTVWMNFDAKNALGNELPYGARCLVLANGKLDQVNINKR